MLQKAGFQQYDFNTSGGTDKTRFYLSGQYSKQKGIIVSNQYERIASASPQLRARLSDGG